MADVTSILPDFAKDTPIWLGLVATAVGALEGALLARQHKKKLDIAGVLVLGDSRPATVLVRLAVHGVDGLGGAPQPPAARAPSFVRGKAVV